MRTQATIRVLNHLIRVCRDAEELCAACSDATESAGLRSLLRYRGEEWGRQGDELQALVLTLGGKPASAGTLRAALGASWMGCKTAFFGPRDGAAITAWQHTQARGLEHYGRALNGYLPHRIRRIVSLQASRVLDRSEKISILRGEYTLSSAGVGSV